MIWIVLGIPALLIVLIGSYAAVGAYNVKRDPPRIV